MKSFGTRKRISMLAVVVAITAVVLAGCDSAGAGGGGASGGSYDITFEVTGSYPDTDPYTLQVDYSYDSSSQGSETKQEFDPTLPFSDTVTLEAGAGVSLGATLLPSGNVTYTLKENGTVIESRNITSGTANFIKHTVGQ